MVVHKRDGRVLTIKTFGLVKGTKRRNYPKVLNNVAGFAKVSEKSLHKALTNPPKKTQQVEKT